MFRIVIGGAASGKSEYAENACRALDGERVYLATMRGDGAAAKERITRHRALRQDKGFATVECERDLLQCLTEHSDWFCDKNVLLEDLPNLVANEMFGGAPNAAPRIISAIYELRHVARHLTLVTGDLASDGITYPKPTDSYLHTLAVIQNTHASEADEVVEVAAGMPSILK